MMCVCVCIVNSTPALILLLGQSLIYLPEQMVLLMPVVPENIKGQLWNVVNQKHCFWFIYILLLLFLVYVGTGKS